MYPKIELAKCSLITRGVKVKEVTNYGIDYYEINMKDFNGNTLNMPTELKHNGSDDQIKLKKLEKGDIVIPVRGSSITNKIAIFDLDSKIPCVVNHQYWVIKPDKNCLNSYYLLFFLLNTETKNLLNSDERNMSDSNMKNISKEPLKDLIIELPPMEIQNKITTIFIKMQEFHKHINDCINLHQELSDSIYSFDEITSLKRELIKLMDYISGVDNLISHFDSLLKDNKSKEKINSL